MEKAAVICSSTARVLHERQGATQINTFEATRRYRRYEPHLFSASFPERPNEEVVDGIHFHRIRSSPIEKLLFSVTRFKNPELLYVYKVAKWIKKLDIKIAHVRNRPLYIPYLKKLLGKEVKLIIHEHNQNIADTLSQKSALEVLNAVDAYVGVSKFTMDYEITKRYSQFSNKAHYILNGVDIDKFRPIWERQAEAEQLRAKYKLGNSKVILFIGAIRERKGIHFLAQTMKDVVAKHPGAKLVIVGGSAKNLEAADPFAKMIHDEAKELKDNIVFLGFVPSSEIEKIYLLADIFAGPSVWDEPFGLVFAEASATGLPVVASKRGGIPEIIRDNVSGLLVDDPSNTADLAGKINCLLDNPEIARKFGEAGRKIMADRFSWNRVANEIENLYDKLIKA